MNKPSTLFLKIVLFAIGALTLVFCIPTLRFVLSPQNVDYLPHLLALYLSVIPFITVLYQAIKLLNFIDQNKAFSTLSVKALKNIKYCAIIFASVYLIVLPYAYYKGDMDDAPGPIAIGLVLIFGAVVAATFAAVLEKLVKNGVEIKSENDLTV